MPTDADRTGDHKVFTIRNVTIQENGVFVVKPSARIGDNPSYYGWGDVVVVRKNGAERLGTRPQALYEL